MVVLFWYGVIYRSVYEPTLTRRTAAGAGGGSGRYGGRGGEKICEYGGKKDDTEIWREVFEKI